MSSIDQPSTIDPIEEMKREIREKIERAKNNPIAESRLAELEEELEKYKKEFVERGSRDPNDTAKEDKIEREIME